MGSMSPEISNEVLNSWKEIARYLNRGVRTAQRWEVELSLPVRRPRNKGRSPVIAMRSEIDLWLKTSMQGKQDGNGLDRFDALRAESRDLRLASQQLCGDLKRSSAELARTVAALVESMERIAIRHQSENGMLASDLINYPPPRAGQASSDGLCKFSVR